MTKIVTDIHNCADCQFLKTKRHYTADSFEIVFDWYCSKTNNKTIEEYIEWKEEKNVKIPNWCPIIFNKKDFIYTVICSDTTIDKEIAKRNFGTEFEVLSYAPYRIEISLLSIIRSIKNWAKESNSDLKLERRVVPKNIVKKLINSGEDFERVCIATYKFNYNGKNDRLKNKDIWFAIYMYSI